MLEDTSIFHGVLEFDAPNGRVRIRHRGNGMPSPKRAWAAIQAAYLD